MAQGDPGGARGVAAQGNALHNALACAWLRKTRPAACTGGNDSKRDHHEVDAHAAGRHEAPAGPAADLSCICCVRTHWLRVHSRPPRLPARATVGGVRRHDHAGCTARVPSWNCELVCTQPFERSTFLFLQMMTF